MGTGFRVSRLISKKHQATRKVGTGFRVSRLINNNIRRPENSKPVWRELSDNKKLKRAGVSLLAAMLRSWSKDFSCYRTAGESHRRVSVSFLRGPSC